MSESVFLTRDREVLQYALEHVVPAGPVVDLTAGNRVMRPERRGGAAC